MHACEAGTPCQRSSLRRQNDDGVQVPTSSRLSIAFRTNATARRTLIATGRHAPNAMPQTDDRRIAIDLSHVIEDGMITYQGLPAPIICDFLSREASQARYADGTEFQIGSIDMVGNTGTYIDSPFHRYADGTDLAGLALSSLANLVCHVVDCTAWVGRAIDTLPLSAASVRGTAVLVRTGWDQHWRTDRYFQEHPHLTGRLAQWLADAGAALVGIDSMNIDCIDTGERPVHTILLGANIPIVEHLCGLGQLPAAGARFFAVPPKVRAFGTFPVRAFALV